MISRWIFQKKHCVSVLLISTPDFIKDIIIAEKKVGLKYQFNLHGQGWYNNETKTEFFLDYDHTMVMREQWILQLVNCEYVHYRKDLSDLQKEQSQLLKL